MTMQSGVYETYYGNAVIFVKGKKIGFDIDMGMKVPLAVIDFTIKIRELEEGDYEY